MIPDSKPIVFNTPAEFKEVEIYFAHDIHYGNSAMNMKKWERFKKDILAEPNRYVILVGDYCEIALANSKSNIYAQQYGIETQRLWMQQQFTDLANRIICICPGNHEQRIYKIAGLHEVYDAAVCAGLADKYRQHFAFVDIGVGKSNHGAGKQVRYFGYATHRLRDCKNYHGGDFVDGVDFIASGHDHQPKDQARSKLRYDSKNKFVQQVDIEVIDSGSFLSYTGSYGVDLGLRPQSSKLYKLVLNGTSKQIKTIGYHI